MTAPGAKPVEIPKHTMRPGSQIKVSTREGTLTYEKQEDGGWEVVRFDG